MILASELGGIALVCAQIGEWLATAVIFGTAVAAMAWLLTTTLLRHARPAVVGLFWLVVLAKFVVPAGPGAAVSLNTIVSRTVAMVSPTQVGSNTAAMASAAVDSSTDGTWYPITAELGAASAVDSAANTSPSWGLPVVLVLGYCIAVALLATLRLWSYARFSRQSSTLPLASADVQACVSAVCRRHGLRAAPVVRISDQITAPYVFGPLRSTLVLAGRGLDDAEALDAVILHELAHLRRFDLLTRIAQWIIGTLLFFWPVVGWVNRRIDLAREAACDEWALRHSRLSPARYARCLLEAVQPRGYGWTAYRPASMGASRKHVERRIDMILSNHTRNSRRTGLAVASGIALAAWAFFALSGASAARLPDDPPKSEVQVTVESTDGEPGEVMVFVTDGQDGAAPGALAGKGNIRYWVQADGAGGENHMMFVSEREMDEASLAAFLADHPVADVDADGVLTMEEHDAFITALAMTSPTTVLEQFPRADVNQDGAMDMLEAARLVTGSLKPEIKVMARHGDAGEVMDLLVDPVGNMVKRHRIATAHASTKGGAVVTQSATAGDGEKNVEVNVTNGEAHIVIRHPDGTVEERTVPVPEGGTWQSEDAEGGQRIMIQRADGDNAGEIKHIVRVAEGADPMALHRALAPHGPELWILSNVSNIPMAATVAAALPAVRQAPLALFLELNPKADANHDGTLTTEERDRFVEAHMTAMRARILEQHPEADTNGDGILTNDEMREFHKSMIPANGRRVIIERTNNGDGESEEVIEIHEGDEPI